MKTTIRFLLIATLLAGTVIVADTTACFAQEEIREKGFYIGLRGGSNTLHLEEDDNLKIDDNGGTAVILTGYSFNEVFSLELSIVSSNFKTDNSEIDLRQGMFQIFAHYRFLPGQAFRPYIKGGLGGYNLMFDIAGVNVDAQGGGLPLGGGFDYFFNRHFSLGVDLTHNIIQYDRLNASIGGGSTVSFAIDEGGASTTFGIGVTGYF